MSRHLKPSALPRAQGTANVHPAVAEGVANHEQRTRMRLDRPVAAVTVRIATDVGLGCLVAVTRPSWAPR